MASSLQKISFSSKHLPIFLILASAIATCLGSSNQDSLSIQPQECIHQHFSALLHLKSGFRFAYSSKSRTRTLSSWNPENRDCCAWEGITCDTSIGHVTGLDLGEFYISGQFDFQSLSHLRSLHVLNLGYNSFDPSPVPSAIGQLDKLTHLNLSDGQFYGQIPMEMASLTRLVSLDLSLCYYSNSTDFITLKLEKPSIGGLIQDMSSLRELFLDIVNMSTEGSEWSEAISSALPNLRKLSMALCGLSGPIHPSFFHLPFLSHLDLSYNNISSAVFNFIIGNLSSLTSLRLADCGLHGRFSDEILRLPRLSELDLSGNNISSAVLDFIIGNLSSLTSLRLADCGLHGRFSDKIWRLPRLSELNLGSNKISPAVFDFIGNLSSLTRLMLYNCSMSGPLPTQLGNFTRLELLDLSSNSFSGSIPSSLLSLPSLLSLSLRDNQLGGQLGEFHNASSSPLESINLRNNKLQGMIPRSIFQLRNLEKIVLHSNNFSDAVDLGLFLNLTKLSWLALSNINLSIMDIKSNSTATSFPQLSHLLLRSCNIETFPNFLRNHGEMLMLDLSSNKLHGKIPRWIWKVGNGELIYLNLSHNALQTIEAPIPHLSLASLMFLDLSSNGLEGFLPIPSPSLVFYSASNNSLSEEIPTSICNMTSLQVLDISGNNFVGRVPQCFGEMNNFLIVLNLRGNSFHGRLPQTFKEDCSLAILDFSDNRLEGQLPISLANCRWLEVLSLENNQIRDTFPSWIQGLANLHVLILRSNSFYGPIALSPPTQEFSSMLQIFDISFNSFNGNLPSAMFCGWKAMTGEENSELEYIQWYMSYFYVLGPSTFYEEVIIRSKSLDMHLQKIPTIYTLVDLSNNCFQGQIPESIGILKSLRVLNMSHNGFIGPIPTSLKNLIALESLDLSQNNISGHIPPEMSELTFLEVLNLSKNQLMGPIPHAKQFLTFINESFQGNPGLCGPPLSKACDEETNGAPSSTFNKEPELLSENEYDWKMIAIGFGIGYGVGMGVFCWTLVLWTKGRRAYNIFVHKMLLLILPCSLK